MLLKNLTLRDFGVFSGHDNFIDLEPRNKYGRKRPIILFGGLNGAGKTTTLTAIRLALYGRQSIGKAVSTSAYHQYLEECIHRPKNTISKPFSSSIELTFDFGRQGYVSEYCVKRSWSAKSKVQEYVEITKDGETIEGLTDDQKQSFLNELIPIGVADLFFFDGEKIADLAEDDSNIALADAINRLLGIDMINRLKADLGIYLRDQKKIKLPSVLSEEITLLEKEHDTHYQNYQSKISEINELKVECSDIEKDTLRLKQKINDLGGAWAQSRQAEESKVEQLKSERDKIRNNMKDLFSNAAPLALAKNQLNLLMNQLQNEKIAKRQNDINAELKHQIEILKKDLLKSLDKTQHSVAKEVLARRLSNTPMSNTKIIHDISETELSHISQVINIEAPKQQEELKKLANQLESIEGQIDTAGINISRAPDERRISDFVAELSLLENKLGQRQSQIKSSIEEAKQHLRLAMDCLRKLRDKESEYNKTSHADEAITLADRSRALLDDFSVATKKAKIELLEQEFIRSFSKLARKEDMQLTASIDPDDFTVTLTDHAGNQIDKKKLSAGEKQIYAIAMLEALGRTSGRNLPIIIDTPLGRLDSKHRNKLVNNYFPTASHQVLVLSTDTEIDEDFYRDLSPEISHAYSVDYDPSEGSSTYNEGYFWRTHA